MQVEFETREIMVANIYWPPAETHTTIAPMSGIVGTPVASAAPVKTR